MNFGHFIKNIYYLFKINLKKDHERLKSSVDLTQLHNILDSFKYEVLPNSDKPVFATIFRLSKPAIRYFKICFAVVKKDFDIF